MSKISIYAKLAIILFLGLCLPTPQQVYAQGHFSRIITDGPSSGKIDFGELSEGESAELEFRFQNLVKPDGDEPVDMMLYINPEEKLKNGIHIRKVNHRWCFYFHPGGCNSYSRNYFLDYCLKDKGFNKMDVSFKKKWITFRFNDVVIAAIPHKQKTAKIDWLIMNVTIDYRWIKKPRNSKSPETQFIEVVNGYLHETPKLFNLNDGDEIRFFVTPQEVFQDLETPSSFAVSVGETATWLIYKKDGIFTASIELNNDMRDMTYSFSHHML